MINPCPISAAASALFEARAQAGLKKYGVTLADAGHDAPALLKHLAEELADALVYVTALRAAMEDKPVTTSPPVSCHWCGGDVRMDTCDGWIYVECVRDQCGATGPFRHTHAEAITDWNLIVLPFPDDPVRDDE